VGYELNLHVLQSVWVDGRPPPKSTRPPRLSNRSRL